MKDITIETLNAQGVARLLDWAAAEGWNPGLDDARVFFNSDPAGFLLLRVEGQPAAGISVVRQNPAHSFLGLYIAAPAHRGRGLGWQLWQAGIAHLEGSVIGLDGVVEQQDNYRRSGFELLHQNIRFASGSSAESNSGGVHSDAGQAAVDSAQDTVKTGDFTPLVLERHGMCQPFRPDRDLVDCLALDAGIGGFERSEFLASWLETVPAPDPQNGPLRHSMVLRDTTGRMIGFGTVRRCVGPHKIGPLLAEREGDAQQLLDALLATANVDQYTIDVPETNTAAMSLCHTRDLVPVFETARMYRGPAPLIDTRRLFGVATLELG